MVVIDKISCIGCGQCEKDCFGHNISLKEGKAHIIGNCFECGHCVAICPVNAAKIQGDTEDEIQTGNRKAEEFLNLIKNRRSIRYEKKWNIDGNIEHSVKIWDRGFFKGSI